MAQDTHFVRGHCILHSQPNVHRDRAWLGPRYILTQFDHLVNLSSASFCFRLEVYLSACLVRILNDYFELLLRLLSLTTDGSELNKLGVL